MKVTVKLFASLRANLPPESDGEKVTWELAEGTTPQQIIDRLDIPERLAQLVMVDGTHLLPDEIKHRPLQAGEILAIFPPIAGG